MTGEQLKQILSTTGMQSKDIAEKLGMSQQNYSAALNVKDVKTGLLETLCIILGKDMSFFYPNINFEQINNNVHTHNMQNGNGTINEGGSELIARLLEELSELRKQNQKLTDKLLGQ